MTQISSFQKDVFSVVQHRLGVRALLEHTLPNGISVDIFVPDHGVAIEIDGHSHFCRNYPDRRVGNAQWKKEIIQLTMGYHVVNITQPAWDSGEGLALLARTFN